MYICESEQNASAPTLPRSFQTSQTSNQSEHRRQGLANQAFYLEQSGRLVTDSHSADKNHPHRQTQH